MKTQLAALAAAIALALPGAASAATVIDFDTPPANLIGGGSYAGYDWDGFDTISLTDLAGGGFPGVDFGLTQGMAGNAVYSATPASTFTTQGANFDLLGLTLASMNPEIVATNQSFTVVLEGLRQAPGGAWQVVASTSLAVGPAGPGVLNLQGFHNLGAVRFNFASTDDAPNLFVMDNLNVQAVPEPSEYALLLAGLGMLGLVARRRTGAV